MKYSVIQHREEQQAGGSHSFPKMYALALLFLGQGRHIFQRRHCQWLTQINFVNIISSSAAFVVSLCPGMPSGTYWEHNLVRQRSHTARHTSISNEFLFYDLIIFQQNPHARVDIQPSKAQTKGGAQGGTPSALSLKILRLCRRKKGKLLSPHFFSFLSFFNSI